MSNNKPIEYFTPIHNSFIRSSNINKKLLLTLIYINRRKMFIGDSSLSLAKLIAGSGYTVSRNNDTIFNQFREQLQFLIDNEFIKLENDLSVFRLKDCIDIKLLDNFVPSDDFTMITFREVDILLQSESSIDKSKLFAVYLYIKSFMRNRNIGDDGGEFKDAKDKPSAFWGTINNIVSDTGISKETINKCLKGYLNIGLLKRRVVGSYVTSFSEGTVRINVPNIYVLNQEGWEQEIEWALDKIKAFHKTTSFDPPALRPKKKKNVRGLPESDAANDECQDLY